MIQSFKISNSSFIIRTLVFFILHSSFFITSAQTNISPGNVTGTWKKSSSPYKILGNITVPKDSTLKIQAGVKIEFQGNYTMDVKGSIQAIGAAADTIIFTAANKSIGWGGMHIYKNKTGGDSNIFHYCKLEYRNGLNTAESYGAIFLDSVSNSRISNCLFQLVMGASLAQLLDTGKPNTPRDTYFVKLGYLKM